MTNRDCFSETVTSVEPVDRKRRRELKDLFAGCKAGLVFVTAFSTRDAMRSFLTQISWETEVWVAEDPEHMIHFNGERFLGPYPDVMPKADTQNCLKPAAAPDFPPYEPPNPTPLRKPIPEQAVADAAHFYSAKEEGPPYRTKK